MKNKKYFLPFLAVIIIIFNSCIGVSMDIQMNRNGSGRITMEYRISNMLDNLGRLDGNESMPTIPVGRRDWERTVERIADLRLVSHSRRETAQDTIIAAVLEFSNPQALTAFLGASGAKAAVTQNGLNGSFEYIIFNDSSRQYDSDLIAAARSAFNDYNFSIRFRSSGNSTLTVTDGEGRAVSTPQSAAAAMQGRRVSLSMKVMDIIGLSGGLGVVVNW